MLHNLTVLGRSGKDALFSKTHELIVRDCKAVLEM